MTPKQEERIKNKIKLIKAELAKDKKFWGGYYHDGRGLRYCPLSLYIKLNDIKGGLRYVNWLDKNFPDDVGSPFFIIECILILFKSKKTEEAEKKLIQNRRDLGYILDLYFKKQVDEKFEYEFDNKDLLEFSNWLTNSIKTGTTKT